MHAFAWMIIYAIDADASGTRPRDQICAFSTLLATSQLNSLSRHLFYVDFSGHASAWMTRSREVAKIMNDAVA